MFLDLANHSDNVYSHLVGGIAPRPIAWVSTQSEQGVDNIAPYSFFTVASVNPPILSVTHVNPRDKKEKDTLQNLKATKQCVVNVVTSDLVDKMNQSCADYPSEVSEFKAADIATVNSELVTPLGVAAAKVRYECKLRDILSFSEKPAGGQVMLLDVVGIFIADEVLHEQRIDPNKLKTVGKMGGDFYSHTSELFAVTRPKIKG